MASHLLMFLFAILLFKLPQATSWLEKYLPCLIQSLCHHKSDFLLNLAPKELTKNLLSDRLLTNFKPHFPRTTSPSRKSKNIKKQRTVFSVLPAHAPVPKILAENGSMRTESEIWKLNLIEVTLTSSMFDFTHKI